MIETHYVDVSNGKKLKKTQLFLTFSLSAPFCSVGAVVLRVPILFGEVESVSESAVTSLWLKVRDTSESCALDHCQQRFPTHTRDVAVVCRKLCERARQVRVRDTNTVAVSRCCGGTYSLMVCFPGPIDQRHLPLLSQRADDQI